MNFDKNLIPNLIIIYNLGNLYLLPKIHIDYQMYVEDQSFQIVGRQQKKYPNFETAICKP